MTVTAQATLFNESVANGVTTSFPYQFKIASADDLTVELDGVATTSGFTVSGVGEDEGGSVVFSVAPANGVTVLRYLDSELSRETNYPQFGDFDADVVNLDFDRIWLALQAIGLKLGLCVRAPISSASGVLPDPVANNVIGWNATANGFQNYAPVDNTLLAADLASTSLSKGAALVKGVGRVVDSISALRTLPKTGSPYAFVLGYYAAGDGGGGRYWYDSTDTSSADNGGTIILASDGGRWKLTETGTLSILQFGADPTGVSLCSTAFTNIVATGKNFDIPDGSYLISDVITLSGTGRRVRASNGAIIKKNGAFDGVVVSGSDWELIGVRVDGNGFGASGIGVTGSGNLITQCESYGNGVHGIYLDGQATTCVRNRINENWSHDNAGVGISANTAPDNERIGNVVYNNGLEGITDDLPSYRSIIANNLLDSNCQTGGVGGIGIDQASGASITGNVIKNTRSNLPGIKFQNNVGGTNYVTVTGNTLVDNTGGGIHLAKNGSYASNENVIVGNTFQNNTTFDIKIDAGCSGNSISGNGTNAVIVDANAGGVNPKSGILCSFRAYNNTLRTDVTGDGTLYAIPLDATNFNNGGAFNTTTGVFTATATGIYCFAAGVRLQGGGASTYAQLQLVQAGSTSQTSQAELDLTAGTFQLYIADHFAMQAGDTLVMKVAAYGSTKTMDIPASAVQTWLSGALVG